MKRLILVFLVALLAAPAFAQLNNTDDIDAAMNVEFLPIWTNGGSSGVREAQRDWCAGTHPNFVGKARCGQCVYPAALATVPIIVFGDADLPAGGELLNANSAPSDRPGVTCGAIVKGIDPDTGSAYVNTVGVSRGVRFIIHEYQVPWSHESSPQTELDRLGWWAELCYLWSATDDGTPDGMRCRTAGEGPEAHNQNWHDVELPE